MSFFLLSKGADGTLSLMSAVAFDARQDALNELSRLTSSPEFDSWDSEVLVIDLDAGTPVLLVRPSAPAAEATVTTPTEAEPSVAQDAPTDAEASAVEDTLTEPAAVDEAAVEESAEADEALAAVMVDLGVDEEPPAAEETAESQAEAEAAEPEDVFVAEAEEEAPVAEVDEAWAQAVADTDAASLKGALKRTAAQMEAQGISAPESVGPAPEDEADAAPGGDTEPEAAPEEEATAEGEPEPAAAGETAAASETSPEAATDDGESVEATTPSEDDADQATPAWPWDTGSGGLSALEEPGLDTESMIRALADDEASRTVVLGEYDGSDIASNEPELLVSAAAIGTAVEPATDVEPTDSTNAPVSEPASDVAPDDLIAGIAVADVEPPAPAQAATAAAPESDFVDLGEVAAPDTKEYEPGEVDISGMTCDDCVYVETCPNKDERIPSTCGSFQWK